MVIEILSQKYKCGCNRGQAAISYPSLLVKFNSIVEWDLCKFPNKAESQEEINQHDSAVTEVMEKLEAGTITEDEARELINNIKIEPKEDRHFIDNEDGDPELKPGDCFLFGGQVIAVDSQDKFVLVVSETGVCGLQRMYDDHIRIELDLYFNDFPTEKIEYEVLEEAVSSDFDRICTVPYELYKTWKDKFLFGRGFVEKDLKLKVDLYSDNFIFSPIELIMRDWDIQYKSSQIDDDEKEEILPELAKEVIAWFYNKYKRLGIKEK